MPATRFILLGYGIGVALGIWTGGHYGQLAGWLTAWLGGGMLSLLIAWTWCRWQRFGEFKAMRPARAALSAPLPLALPPEFFRARVSDFDKITRQQADRAYITTGERRGVSAGSVSPSRGARSGRARPIRTGAS